ncbi:MAG TPA: hypothetical protein VNT03_09770 [Baekduia sp.]|nr:hypothetical protein [Baekduia sp.]
MPGTTKFIINGPAAGTVASSNLPAAALSQPRATSDRPHGD